MVPDHADQMGGGAGVLFGGGAIRLTFAPMSMSAHCLADRLAAMYQQSDAAVPAAAELESFRRWIRAEYARITVPVIYVPIDLALPATVAHYRRFGVLVISVAHNSHPYLSATDNGRFRAVHDWHHIKNRLDSTLRGEIGAFRVARRSAPPSIHWILFSEIVLQAAACISTGTFQAQRLVKGWGG